MEGSDLVQGVTCERAVRLDADAGPTTSSRRRRSAARGAALHVAAYDFGMKWNILRRLSAHGCDVRVFPATTPASELLATKPDGVFLSNGPGDPAALTYAIDNAQDAGRRRTCRCSASASATRSSASRWAARRSS